MSHATIIRERPRQRLPEVPFDAFGNSLWVLFEDDDYCEWCGIFGAGDLQYEGKVEPLIEGDYLVLVAGRIYRVNVNARSLAFASDERILTDAIYVRSRDLLIACDFTNLFAYHASGRQWRSDRVSFDGITLTRSDDDCVYGFVDDMSDVGTAFTLHLENMCFESAVNRSMFGI